MAAEAEKLINISLTKIAKSRAQRGGVSLHRNLLVATVLQKARFVFMEEAYHMVQRHDSDSELSASRFEEEHQKLGVAEFDFAVRDQIASVEERDASVDADSRIFTLDDEDADKENLLSHELNSCKSELEARIREDSSILREKLETNLHTGSSSAARSSDRQDSSPSSLKRRRTVVSEWETEEAVLSILPKKVKKGEEFSEECEESSLLDEVVTVLPFSHSNAGEEEVTSMDIDRITSLVSIFSFGGLTAGANPDVLSGGVIIGGSGEAVGKLTRSVSTPDLCSAQAKEGSGVDVMQRPFLAMTV